MKLLPLKEELTYYFGVRYTPSYYLFFLFFFSWMHQQGYEQQNHKQMVLQRVGTIMVISKQDLPHIGHPNPFKMGSIPKPYYNNSFKIQTKPTSYLRTDAQTDPIQEPKQGN